MSSEGAPGPSSAPSSNGTQPPPETTAKESQGVGKQLSNAEQKKLKKAEKAARRAQDKEQTGLPIRQQQQQQQPKQQQNKSEAPGNGPARQQNAGSSTSGSKTTPQKRRPSTSKATPHRPTMKEIAEKPASKGTKQSLGKQVALFGHLYGQPRRTTLEGAGRDVHPAVLALGLKLGSYAICGSTARCVAMLLAFKKVIASYTTPPGNSLPRHLTSHLSPQIDYLVSCRPLSTSMGNAIRWLKLEINDVDPDTDEDRAKLDLCDAIDVFIRDRITVAGRVIADAAQAKIEDGDVVLTFAKSSVVQQTLVQALAQGRRFRVIVVDSRPLREGRNLARSLADVGIDVTYSTTHAIGHLVSGATKVLLGAHSMLGNGRLYSRAGTALVAMSARDADIPVIVCCESVKFTDRVALDSIVTNEVAPPDELVLPGRGQHNNGGSDDAASALSHWRETPNLQLLNLMYDVTPAEFISTIITEHGSLPPTSVPVVHRLSTNT